MASRKISDMFLMGRCYAFKDDLRYSSKENLRYGFKEDLRYGFKEDLRYGFKEDLRYGFDGSPLRFWWCLVYRE